MWCTKSGVIFQETKLICHRAWTWTSDSKNQLLIVITCLIIQTVLPSFPSSVPHSLPFFLGTTSQMKHLHYNSCSRPPSGGSKLKHSSALLTSFTHLPDFSSDPKKTSSQRVASVWHFQGSSGSWKDSMCIISSFCRVDIFCGYKLHLMIFSCLIAGRTLAWKVLGFDMILL